MNRWLGLLLVLFPGLVLAQAAGQGLNFVAPPTDISIDLLGNIFGVVDGVLHGNGSQIIGTMFGVFNSAVMSLGITILTYTFGAGVIKTAHEGEALGRQWSSIWIPIRSAAGIALLWPRASGYCPFQIFVMWIVVQGVGAADTMWQTALGYLTGGGVIVAQSEAAPRGGTQMDAIQAAGGILASEVCMYGLQQQLQNYRKATQPDPGPVPKLTPSALVLSNKSNTGAIYFPGVINADAYPYYSKLNAAMGNDQGGVCGAVAWQNIDVNALGGSSSADSKIAGFFGAIGSGASTAASWTAQTAGNAASSGINLASGKVANTAAPENNNPILTRLRYSQALAIQQMVLDLDPVAETIASNFSQPEPQPLGRLLRPMNPTDPSSQLWGAGTVNNPLPSLLQGRELNDAAADYVNIVSPVLRIMKQGFSNKLDFVNGAIAKGWILAGSYYFDLARLNDDVSKVSVSALASKITVTPPSANFLDNSGTNPVLQSVLPPGSPYLVQLNNLVNKSDFGTYANMKNGQNKDYLSSAYDYQISYGNQGTTANIARGFGSGAVGNLEGAATVVLNIVMPVLTSIGRLTAVFAGLSDAQRSNANPVILVAMLGTTMLDIVSYIWFSTAVAFTALATALAAIPYVNFSNPVNVFASWFVPFLTLISGLLFSTGITLAYYVPMIPYIIFTFAAIGWFIGVIEAMVAAPLVAIGIAHPEGHEILGKSEPAVMLLVNVFLRPMMMLFGLFFGMILSYVGIWLLNDGFGHAIKVMVVAANSIVSLIFVPIAMAVLYAALVVAILMKVFSLIWLIPDKVLRWIQGGIQESLGADAVQAGQSQVQGALGQAAQTAGGALQRIKGEEQAKAGAGGRQGAATVSGGRTNELNVGTDARGDVGTGRRDLNVGED